MYAKLETESSVLDGARVSTVHSAKMLNTRDTNGPRTLAHHSTARTILGTGTELTVYAIRVSHIDHHASCGDRATLLPRCPPVAARLPRQGDVGSRGDDAVVPPKQGRRPTPERAYGYA